MLTKKSSIKIKEIVNAVSGALVLLYPVQYARSRLGSDHGSDSTLVPCTQFG